jgi:hypothetical protein
MKTRETRSKEETKGGFETKEDKEILVMSLVVLARDEAVRSLLLNGR